MLSVIDRGLYNKLVDRIRFDLETGCWNWDAYIHTSGYGQFSYKGTNKSAHRLMWMAVHGDFKELDVCHRCDNKRCISPLHLYLGTHQQNLRDASKRKLLQGQWKTHCKRGHPLSGENLGLYPSGFRHCKACHLGRERMKKYGWPEDLAYSLPPRAKRLSINSMSICPHTGKQCCCQPSEGVMCE